MLHEQLPLGFLILLLCHRHVTLGKDMGLLLVGATPGKQQQRKKRHFGFHYLSLVPTEIYPHESLLLLSLALHNVTFLHLVSQRRQSVTVLVEL